MKVEGAAGDKPGPLRISYPLPASYGRRPATGSGSRSGSAAGVGAGRGGWASSGITGRVGARPVTSLNAWAAAPAP